MFSAFQTFGKLGAASGRTLAQQIAAMSPSLWLEPSVTNGYQDSAGTTALTQPGGGSADPPVGKVLDLSGLGNHATQSTSTARPKLSARVNLCSTSETHSVGTLGIAGGTTPPTIAVGSYAGLTCESIAFPAGVVGYSASRRGGGGSTCGWWPAELGKTYQASVVCALSRPLVSGEEVVILITGTFYAGETKITSGTSDQTVMTRIFTDAFTASSSGSLGYYVYPGGSALTAPLTVYITKFDARVYSAAVSYSSYQAVTDANNYAYAGWPLIHVYDTVDDVMNVTFPSSLGSDCTVVTANRGTTPTILTGQTIGTSYTITATNAGRLVFPRALTAAETAIVTKWATQKGALPS